MTQFKINYQYEIILLLLKNESHGRGLAKELKTSLTRIQTNLSELRDSNVLDYKTEGKNHIYFLKKNLMAKLFILNSENYKLAKLLKKNPILEPLFMDILTKFPGKIILLFGSYSKFIPKEESDIDLYVDTNDNKVKQEIESLFDKLSVKIGEFNNEDLLIQEIIRNHVIIQGGESYYRKLNFFK